MKLKTIQQLYDERWLPVPDWEGFYEVSNFGNVRSLGRAVKISNNRTLRLKGKLIRLNPDKEGYVKVGLQRPPTGNRTVLSVHRMVMSAFQGKSELHVNHINGDPSDNRLENLEYVCRSDNALHKKSKAYPGVWFAKHKNGWVSMFNYNKKRIYVGKFPTAEEAYAAYLNRLSSLGLQRKYSRVEAHQEVREIKAQQALKYFEAE